MNHSNNEIIKDIIFELSLYLESNLKLSSKYEDAFYEVTSVGNPYYVDWGYIIQEYMDSFDEEILRDVAESILEEIQKQK